MEISIFIVEDDPMVKSIIQQYSERIPSCKVFGSGNSETESIKTIKLLKPNLVLLDIFLPDGNGLNLLKRLRQENISTDVILITAARDTETVQEALRFGAVDYLIKPFNFERFHQAIMNYLSLKNLFEQHNDINQVDIDMYNYPFDSAGCNNILSLPKGVHLLTLKSIINYLYEQHSPKTSKEIADALQMSRITTWRYLEYLSEKGKVEVSLEYGSKGRPTKQYRIAK